MLGRVPAATAASGCTGSGGGNGCSNTLTPTEVLFAQASTGAITTLAINTGGNALALMCTTATAGVGQIVVANVSSTVNYLYAMKVTPPGATTPGTATIDGFLIGHVAPVTLTSVGSAFTISGTGFFRTTFELQADPSGRFLTLTDTARGFVHVLRIGAGGALSEAAGSPFSAANALFTAVGPTGNFLYVTDQSDGQIFIFSINVTANPVLAQITNSPFQEPTHLRANAPISMQVGPSGNFLYTANNQSISFYAINTDGSLLGNIAGSPFTPSPQFNPQLLAMDNTSTFLYATGTGTEGVLGFTMSSTSGLLTPIGGSPFASGLAGGVIDIVPDLTLPVMYLQINGGINAYTINVAAGGALVAPTKAAQFTAATNLAVASVQ